MVNPVGQEIRHGALNVSEYPDAGECLDPPLGVLPVVSLALQGPVSLQHGTVVRPHQNKEPCPHRTDGFRLTLHVVEADGLPDLGGKEARPGDGEGEFIPGEGTGSLLDRLIGWNQDIELSTKLKMFLGPLVYILLTTVNWQLK